MRRLVARLRTLDLPDVVLGASVFAAGSLVWLATRSGPGISNDSVAYLATAQHLAHEGRLTNFDGQRLSIFPPGYSAAVAAMLRAGVHTQQSVRILGIATAMFVVVATRWLGRAMGLTRLAASLGSAFVALSMGLVFVHSMAWSEPIFVCASLVCLVGLVRLHRGQHWDRADLALVIGGAGVAGATRYTGLVLLAVIGLVLLVDRWPTGRGRALVSAGGVAAASAWGLGTVVVINLADGRAPLGQRGGGATYEPGEVGGQFARAAGRYLLGTSTSDGVASRVGGLAMLLLMAWLAVGIWRLTQRPSHTWRSPLTPVVTYVVASLAVLALSETTTMLNAVDQRLLAPTWVPLVLLVTAGASRAWRVAADSGRAPAFLALGLVLVGTAFAVSTAETTRWATGAGTSGIKLNAVDRRDVPWVHVVRDLPADAALVSDNPYAVRWLAAREPVTPVPGRAFYAWVPFEERLVEVRAFIADHGGGYLVLTEGPNQRVIDSLRWVGLHVELHARAPGVEVFELTAPTASQPRN